MRKRTAIFLLVIMSLITSVGAINVESLIKTTTAATEIKAVGMPLQDLLDLFGGKFVGHERGIVQGEK